MTAAQTETVRNIALLARDCYDANTRKPTSRMGINLQHIAEINFQELKNKVIGNALCNIHNCDMVNVQAVEAEALRLGNEQGEAK